ncbi:MAG: LCP family protein [Chloroflexi bacterium]|nr:LCP family protein [Chloroflexota bacterium]
MLPLLISLIGGLVAAGYVLWQWSATLSRTNVLILGIDRRPEEGNVVRSDTIVLATIYPRGPRTALLSIPRDLYVEIPGHGSNRINTAHFWGENKVEGNGPTLAMQTVVQNLGVPVHHYVRVDFDGFRAIVDAVGGIDIVVEDPIVDNEYPTADYGTIQIEIPAGTQRMDGETALRYARSRHGSSDFDRVKRQQQVLIALAQRMLEPGAWLKLPLVYQAILNHAETDMTGQDLLLMAPTLYRTGSDNIEHHVIDHEMARPWTSPTGGAVLLPEWELISSLVQELFAP